MYENAYQQKQDNEELLSSLFMSYVRLGDYKKQQQTAMALHRLRPNKNPYYFWAIMSIVMQVGPGNIFGSTSMMFVMTVGKSRFLLTQYVIKDYLKRDLDLE